MVQLCGQQDGGSSKHQTELPYDPAIPPLGTSTKDLKAGTQPDISIPMFTATLLTTAKRQKKIQMSMNR